MNLIVHTDGGARGNPGPAAVGVVIEQYQVSLKEEKKLITQWGKRIGETTNNVAEYKAVIEALLYIKNAGLKNLQANFYLDSNLVVQQLNGRFKVKNSALRELIVNIRILETEISGIIHYNLIPREQNTRADAMVNAALDS